MIEDLNGCVAVVTGGASGIGLSTARALAAAGAAVVIADIHDERMRSACDEITAGGGRAIGCRCDVASDDDVAALRAAAVETFGAVDIVMNNVGILMLGAPENIPLAAWERTFNVNVLSVARSIHAFLPEMLERGRGHIVNTASTAGLWGYSPDRIPYASSKAAVIAALGVVGDLRPAPGRGGDLPLSGAGEDEHRRAGPGLRSDRTDSHATPGGPRARRGRGPGPRRHPERHFLGPDPRRSLRDPGRAGRRPRGLPGGAGASARGDPVTSLFVRRETSPLVLTWAAQPAGKWSRMGRMHDQARSRRRAGRVRD